LAFTRQQEQLFVMKATQRLFVQLASIAQCGSTGPSIDRGMAARGGRADAARMPVEVRAAAAPELPAGAALLASALGFSDRDAIPAWHMQDVAERGGLALVAVDGAVVVGFSYAVPAVADGVGFLFSSGLAIRADRRGRGIGRRLKLAQGREAAARGHTTIRWTADPLSVPALRLYLTVLGARVVGYRPDAYRGVRRDGGVPHDDVDVEWLLDGVSRTPEIEAAVELPLGDRDGWRLRVRGELYRRLADGAEGVGIRVDRAAGRAWMDLAAAAR
jgi:predicted GNAT superfamily acetyltransferase